MLKFQSETDFSFGSIPILDRHHITSVLWYNIIAAMQNNLLDGSSELVDLSRFFIAKNFTDKVTEIFFDKIYLYIVNIKSISPIFANGEVDCTINMTCYAFNEAQYTKIYESGNMNGVPPLREIELSVEIGDISDKLLESIESSFGKVEKVLEKVKVSGGTDNIL